MSLKKCKVVMLPTKNKAKSGTPYLQQNKLFMGTDVLHENASRSSSYKKEGGMFLIGEMA